MIFDQQNYLEPFDKLTDQFDSKECFFFVSSLYVLSSAFISVKKQSNTCLPLFFNFMQTNSIRNISGFFRNYLSIEFSTFIVLQILCRVVDWSIFPSYLKEAIAVHLFKGGDPNVLIFDELPQWFAFYLSVSNRHVCLCRK